MTKGGRKGGMGQRMRGKGGTGQRMRERERTTITKGKERQEELRQM